MKIFTYDSGKKTQNHKGFSIIEIIIITSCVIIIGTFSSFFFTRLMGQNDFLNTTNQIAGQIRKAQTYAISGKQNSSWGVSYTNQEIILFKGSSYAQRDSAFDETLTLAPTISIQNFTEIVFAKTTGLPSSSVSVILNGKSEMKTILINSYGMVSR